MTDITATGGSYIKTRIGFTLIILHILAVVAVQLALSAETVREVFTPIDRMEGTSNAAVIDNIGIIEVELTMESLDSAVDINGDESRSYANIRILVNGKFAGYFDQPRVRLAVRNNSLIEIDARTTPNPHRISIYSISNNALEISRGLEVITNQNIAILGKIFANP